jgi:hypothetical protein
MVSEVEKPVIEGFSFVENKLIAEYFELCKGGARAAVGTDKLSPKVIDRGGKSESLPANPRIRTLHVGSEGLFSAGDHGYRIPANQDGPSTPIDQAACGECGLMDGNDDD